MDTGAEAEVCRVSRPENGAGERRGPSESSPGVPAAETEGAGFRTSKHFGEGGTSQGSGKEIGREGCNRCSLIALIGEKGARVYNLVSIGSSEAATLKRTHC